VLAANWQRFDDGLTVFWHAVGRRCVLTADWQSFGNHLARNVLTMASGCGLAAHWQPFGEARLGRDPLGGIQSKKL